jgi:ABC-type transport system involved in multi-copper enzyme maturation permease subunit
VIRVLALKELLDQVSSVKFIFLFAVSTVLIVLSLYTGSAAYVAARAEHRATEALARRETENRQDYGELTRFGVKVARPPGALSAVAAGVEPALGRSARVRPQGEPEFSPPPVAETPVLAVLGQLDLNAVVRVFLSLFALLLTYDAVAGEKESGTLKAVLSNPVPRTQLLLGKALGLFGTLLVATLVPALLGLLVMKVGFRIELDAGDWTRIASIGATFGLYLLAVFATGLLVSTLTTRSSVAFLVLLLFWVGSVEVVPKLSPMVAGRLRPVPDFASLQSDRDRIQNEFQQAQFRVMQTAFQAAQITAPAASPDDFDARQRMIDSIVRRGRDSLQQDIQARTAQLDEGYRNRQNAFTRLAVFLARFSPAVAMSHAVEVLSGTDFEADRRWRANLLAYREDLRGYLKAKGVDTEPFGMRIAFRTESQSTGGGRRDQTFTIGPRAEQARLDLAGFPTFAPRREGLGQALGRIAPDLLVLGLYTTVALLLAFGRFLRYDVR